LVRTNDLAHLPAPNLQNHYSEQAHQRMQKAVTQRSAEGAGQVQPLLDAPPAQYLPTGTA
jgi:hypothetical protein